MAKKTKDQLFTEWQSKISKRHSFRKSLPEYQELIRKLSSGQDATDELKTLLESYGPIDPYLEDISPEEVELLGEASVGTGVSIFADTWIVKPIKWAWKSSLISGEGWGGRDKVNWNVFLDDEGFVRFAVRENTPRQIKEAIESWLNILEKNKVIVFDPQGKPKVIIVGSLLTGENPGVILSLNPFARKENILIKVIQALKEYRSFSFRRRDLSHPKRVEALTLQKQGKSLREIASNLWPDEFAEEEKRIDSIKSLSKERRILCEQYAIDLLFPRKEKISWSQALRKAKEEFGVKGRLAINPLLVRAYRLIK